jgi:para-aminobenzoate synthetase component I
MLYRPIAYRDPIAAFAPLAAEAGAVLLHSAALQHKCGRYSIIAANPVENLRCGVDDPAPLDRLADRLAARLRPVMDAPFPMRPGAIGFLSYDLNRTLERLPASRHEAQLVPQLCFGFYDCLAVFDSVTRQAWVCGYRNADLEGLEARLGPPQDLPPVDWAVQGQWQGDWGRADYLARVQKIHDHIRAGDVYQANLSQRFVADRPAGLNDFMLYRRLTDLSPAPFSAFLQWGDLAVASASPERFLQMGAAGQIETRPIKGTRRRDPDPVQDAGLAEELCQSEKDRAENLMIVDLMRSDLAKVSVVGSVDVPQLCALERFASVHHLVSVVTSQIRPGLGPVDVLKATFPGGSITGAPKIRAMEILQDLESAPRGVFCGAIGWIGDDGAMDFNIAIRTLTCLPDQIVAFAGGGITILSDAAAEYDESLLKLRPLLAAVTGGR